MADGIWLMTISDQPSAISHQPSAIVVVVVVDDPIRRRSGETCPQDREPRRADDEREPLLPPRVRASAELQPRGRCDERRTNGCGKRTATDEPKHRAANPAKGHALA